jgi:hypothetical protein
VLAGGIGFLGLLAGPLLVIASGHGGGLAERIALYPLIIWLIVFGCAMLGGDHLASQSGRHVVVAHKRTLERAGAMRDRTQVDRIPR